MVELFDPARLFNLSHEEYRNVWILLLNTLFQGIWAKVFATVFLFLSVYSVIRRKFRPVIAVICFIAAVVFAYAGNILKLLSN